MAEAQQISWEPGNGTRYDLVLVVLEVSFAGHSPGMMLVTLSRSLGPVSMVIDPVNNFLHYIDVALKTGINSHDASCVCEMLGIHLGIGYSTVDEDWYRLGIRNPYVA